MGTAILKGLLSTKTRHDSGSPSLTYTAWVRTQNSLQRLHDALGNHRKHVDCVAGGDLVASIAPAHIVILGFPPDQLQAIIGSERLVEAVRGKLIISLLAGVSYDRLTNALQAAVTFGAKPQILREIPSIGASINASVTLIAETTHTGTEHQQVTTWLFQRLGQVQWLPESLMNEATAAGAAADALTMVAVDAIVDASVAEGIPRPAEMRLAAASLPSSAALLLAGDLTPKSLKESMSVPKGITVNSVLELERGHVRSAIVRHAISYTRNM
ncbi:MAG: hypothetical protein Q9173_001108 [Seirophora scorigena]